MSEESEYRCFVGKLAWSTSDRGLRDAFDKFGRLLEAKVVVDKFSGRSRGFGFVTYDDKKAMDDAIAAMDGMDLDGRTITVEKSQPQGGSGRDYGGDRRDRDRDSSRSYGGGRGSGGGDCFKCGKPGHFARECSSEGSRGGGGRYGGRDDRYGGRDDKYGGRDDKYGGRDDRYSGGGSGRYGPDRNGDRHGGRSRDGGGSRGSPGGERYSRDRSGPYERPKAGGFH